MSATAWIVLGLAALLLVWAVAVYNRLVQLQKEHGWTRRWAWS